MSNKDNEPLKEDPQDYASKPEEEAVEDHLAPSRWWFVTTLFPLIAATFGPLATAFNICALTTSFRVLVDLTSTAGSQEQEGSMIADPAWATALNVLSLVFAVVANLALFVLTYGRISTAVGFPIIVVGWYISSFLLIGLVAAAPAHLQLPAGEPRTWAQSYYYACLAAAIYFVLATIMTITAWRVQVDKLARGFKLSMAQQTLMLQVIMFLGYWLIMAAVYAHIESWEYLDAVYWTLVTVFTIGFGDFAPATHLGRGLIFPAALGGILFVGLIVASIRSVCLERGSSKVSVRNVEKARRRIIKRRDAGNGSTSSKDNEAEFDAMRRAQHQAKRINIITALSISAGSWLFLWIIGGVVFWQAELNTQGWTYFQSLYFCYISFVTVGYGDFEIRDNAGKPAFVMWAMLALPTLTVLIGAIGDSISGAVNEATLAIAEKLPRKTAGLSALKDKAEDSKKGKDGAFNEAKPPGFMEGDLEENLDDSADAHAVQGLTRGSRDDVGEDKKQKGEHYRGYLLMKEIKNVVGHMDASPPRKYSYGEWCWFIKLLGEDESQYQWLHRDSPLMEATDEPKWVLQRLMEKLETELKSDAEEGVDARGR